MGAIKLEKIEKWFGDVQVIKGVGLETDDGEIVVFVSPSGCALKLPSSKKKLTAKMVYVTHGQVDAMKLAGQTSFSLL
jgi:multiple sugar transport system ATP-binding protein